mgnify:CR=1 FL=1
MLPGHWAYNAVEYCYAKSVCSGISPTQFGPDNSMIRGDFMLMLYNAAGKPAVSTPCAFTDVAESDYYYTALAWAQGGGGSGLDGGVLQHPVEQRGHLGPGQGSGGVQISVAARSQALGYQGGGPSCLVTCQQAPHTGTVTGAENGLNIRSGPGTTYPSVGGLRNGAQTVILAQQNGWYQILFRAAFPLPAYRLVTMPLEETAAASGWLLVQVTLAPSALGRMTAFRVTLLPEARVTWV